MFYLLLFHFINLIMSTMTYIVNRIVKISVLVINEEVKAITSYVTLANAHANILTQ